MGVQGGSRVPFIGAERGPWRAGPREHGGAEIGLGGSPSWIRRGEDGASDGRGPRVGERKGKGSAERAGPRDGPAREGKGLRERSSWAAGVKERDGPGKN